MNPRATRQLQRSQVVAASVLHGKLVHWARSDRALQRLQSAMPGFDVEASLIKVAAISQLFMARTSPRSFAWPNTWVVFLERPRRSSLPPSAWWRPCRRLRASEFRLEARARLRQRRPLRHLRQRRGEGLANARRRAPPRVTQLRRVVRCLASPAHRHRVHLHTASPRSLPVDARAHRRMAPQGLTCRDQRRGPTPWSAAITRALFWRSRVPGQRPDAYDQHSSQCRRTQGVRILR